MTRSPSRHHRSRKPAKAKKPSLPKGLIEVSVSAIGAKGDGLAKDREGVEYFVPYSTQGDVLEIRCLDKRGDVYVGHIENIITPSPDRAEAPCPYYTQCGGCSLQHLNDKAYGQWKKERISEALNRMGIEAEIDDPVLIPQGQRRRAAFAVMKKGKKIVFGFNAKSSHRIEEIDHCLLLTQPLDHLIQALRALMPHVMKQEGRGDIIVNYGDDTCDVVFALPGRPDLKVHEKLIAFAEQNNIGRMSWQENAKGDPEIIAQRRHVEVTFAQTKVELPANPFLQPSKMGEEAMTGLALQALDAEKKILDLYCGCGSFTFALAQKAIVHGVEANPTAIKALELSAGRGAMGGRITTEVRDLTRQPLMGKELEKFDAVLFDPPRAGAKEQAEELAKSNIALIIAVSCNPTTFARDASALIEGGYKLEKVVPIDQFTWSAHVEVLAIFRKN